MRRRTVAAIGVAGLVVVGCANGDATPMAPSPSASAVDSPTALQTPSLTVIEQCRSAAPIVKEFSDTADRVRRDVITIPEGTDLFRQQQQQLDDLAEMIPDLDTATAMHALADAVGQIRVAGVTGTSFNQSALSSAGEALTAACQKAP